MSLSSGLLFAILILGVGQGLLIAALLLRRVESTAHRLLAALMLAYAVFLAQELAVAAELYRDYPRWTLQGAGLPLLFGPLHFLFARFLTHPGRRFRPSSWLHFAPFVLYRIAVFPVIFWDRDRLMTLYGQGSDAGVDVFNLVAVVLIAAQGLTYMVLTLLLLQRVRQDGRVDAGRLRWLGQVTWLAAGVWSVVGIQVVLIPFGLDLFKVGLNPVAILTGIMVYATGYLGLRRAGDFISSGSKAPGEPEPAYARSGLSSRAARRHLESLVALMESERPFRDSSLTLQELADRLSLSKHHLSEVLNTERRESFFDFVNGYRVEEVKRMLRDPAYDHLTLMAVAMEAGFSSKSTFNDTFKRLTGMTPSQFRDRR